MKCKNCAKTLVKSQRSYCSITCQKDFQYKNYIVEWKAGNRSGIRGHEAQNFSQYIIRYLLNKYDNQCSLCGWSKINPITKRCPLEIDHVDGNSNNNTEDNLRLLCPNCHSLTPNYKNLNIGSGRMWRRNKYVKIVRTPL